MESPAAKAAGLFYWEIRLSGSSREERLLRACRRVAYVIRDMWDERKGSDTRLLNPPLIPDELVIVGRSRGIIGKSYREHVIPRRVIVLACHAMAKAEKSEDVIAKFIADHLKIILISPEEAKWLDGPDLRLRQTMPKNWNINDEEKDHFARLKAAGIEWDPVDLTRNDLAVEIESDGGDDEILTEVGEPSG